jgi:hypothetical protein
VGEAKMHAPVAISLLIRCPEVRSCLRFRRQALCPDPAARTGLSWKIGHDNAARRLGRG